MSTKIYNGYMINKPLTLLQVYDLIKPFQKKVRQVCNRLVMTNAGQMAATIIDRRALGLPVEAKGSAISHVFHETMEGYRKSKNSDEHTNYDYECSVTVFPMRSKTLFMLFQEQKEYKKAFCSIKGMKEYYYFDNTDKPDEIPQQEWNQRILDWDKVLGYDEGYGYNAPCTRGFSIECIGKYGLPVATGENILEFIPPFSKRVKDRAFEKAFSVRMKEVEEGKAPRRDGECKVGKIEFLDMTPIFEWSRSKEAEPVLKKYSAGISLVLKKKITLSDLRLDPEKEQ